MDESRSKKARGGGAQQSADGSSKEKGVDGRPVKPAKGFPPPLPNYGHRVQGRQQEIIAHAYPNGAAHLNPNQQFFSQSSVDWRNFNGDSSQPPAPPLTASMSPFQFAMEKRISGLQSTTPDHGNSPAVRGLSFPVSPMGNPNTDKNLMRQLVELEHTLKAERDARVMNEEALSMRCSLLSDELSNLQRRYTDLSVGGASQTPARSRFAAFQPESHKASPLNRPRRSLVTYPEDSPRTEQSYSGSPNVRRRSSVDFIQRRPSADFIQNEDVKVSATLVPTWTIAASERKSFAFLESRPKPSPLSPHRLEERLFSDSATKPSATVGYPESFPATPNKDLARDAPPGPRSQITPPRISPRFAAQQAPVFRNGNVVDGGFRSVMPPPPAPAPARSMDVGWRGAAGWVQQPVMATRSSMGALDGGWRGVSQSMDHTSMLRASAGTLDGAWATSGYSGQEVWRHASGSVSQPGNISNIATANRSRFSGMDRPVYQQPQHQAVERYVPPGPAYAPPQQTQSYGGTYTHNNTASASFMHSRPLPVKPEPPAPPRQREMFYTPPTAQQRPMTSKIVPVAMPSRVRNENEMLGGYPTPLKKAIAFTDQLKREDPRPRSGDYVGMPLQTGEVRARMEEAQRQQMSAQMTRGWAGLETVGSVGLVLQGASFGSGVLVCQLLPGLPAKLDGTIRAGDMLTMIENWNVAGKSLEEVQRMLEGAEGSIVLLSLVRFVREMQGGVQQRPFSVRLRRCRNPALPTAAAYRGFA